MHKQPTHTHKHTHGKSLQSNILIEKHVLKNYPIPCLSFTYTDTPSKQTHTTHKGSSGDPLWCCQAKDCCTIGRRAEQEKGGGTWINHAFRPHRTRHKHTHLSNTYDPHLHLTHRKIHALNHRRRCITLTHNTGVPDVFSLLYYTHTHRKGGTPPREWDRKISRPEFISSA